MVFKNKPKLTAKGKIDNRYSPMSEEHKGKISNALKGKMPKNIVGGWNKGMKNYLSQESLQKMSNAHKGQRSYWKGTKGILKTNSGSFKKGYVSKTPFKKGMTPWNKGLKKELNPLYKIPRSEEVKRKISIANKGKKRTEDTKMKIRIARAKQKFPIKDTSIEIKIQKFLALLKIEFYTHHYIKEIDHFYSCDVFIPHQTGINQKTIIECDGDYWHGNPQKYPNPSEHIKEQIKRDEIRTKELLNKGFNVIRLWENKINRMNIKDLEMELINK